MARTLFVLSVIFLVFSAYELARCSLNVSKHSCLVFGTAYAQIFQSFPHKETRKGTTRVFRYSACLTMMLILDVFVAVVLCYFAACNGYVGQAAVSISEGRCEYDGWYIPVNQSRSLESPCELWECEERSSVVTITGCSPVHVGPACKQVQGKGEFPYCCMASVCGSAAFKQ
nr:uncharacterized protein LOC129382383 [Dermacentor andersoni]